MWKWMSSFWENYKYRFVPWIVMNLRQKKQTGSTLSTMHSSKAKFEPQSQCQNDMQELHQWSNAEMTSRGSVIVHNVSQGDDKLLTDNQLTGLMISFFDKLLEYEKEHGKIGQNFSSKDVIEANDMSSKSKELMHKVFGYSVERRKSHVSEEAGTGVFLASGQAPAGSLIGVSPFTRQIPNNTFLSIMLLQVLQSKYSLLQPYTRVLSTCPQNHYSFRRWEIPLYSGALTMYTLMETTNGSRSQFTSLAQPGTNSMWIFLAVMKRGLPKVPLIP